jgi:proline iminopeptidase
MHGIWDTLSSTNRCVVLDQRGTAKSFIETVDSASLTMERYMDDLETLRKHLQAEQLTLIGHSWGGMLAMEYASQHPGQVKQLVLLDPGGVTSKFWGYFSDNILMRLRDEDLKELHLLDSLHKPTLSAKMPGYFYDRQKALDFKSGMDASIFGQPKASRYTITSYNTNEQLRTTALATYKGPVDIIQGRQDPIGESTAYEIKTYLPQTQIHFIERCGHLPWLENAEQVHDFFRLLYKALK